MLSCRKGTHVLIFKFIKENLEYVNCEYFIKESIISHAVWDPRTLMGFFHVANDKRL